MLKIRIFSIGKTKEAWLDEALQEYEKRLSSTVSLEYLWARDDAQLIALVEKETRVVCLDPQGPQMTSKQFSQFLHAELEKGGSRLAFVIGGADGLPLSLRKTYPLLSLSPLTFTHQITRLILIEQIYRGLEIVKGSPYHK